MRIHEDILRYMSIRVDEHEEEPSIMMQNKNSRDERGRGQGYDRTDEATEEKDQNATDTSDAVATANSPEEETKE